MDDPLQWGAFLELYVAVAYEVVGDPVVQILECETAGEFGPRLLRDGVPEYVQLQVQHKLAVAV